MKMILRYLEIEKFKGGAETKIRDQDTRSKVEPDCSLTLVNSKLLRSTVTFLASPIWRSFPAHLARGEPLPICLSTSAASSGEALGKIPGSVKLVLSREMITNTKSTPPITGMKTVRCSTRNGQLWRGKRICCHGDKLSPTCVFYQEVGCCRSTDRQETYSNAKKRPHVTTIRTRVMGRTPLCLARMSRPSQKKRFFPGNTSHFLRGRGDLFPGRLSADEGDTDSARGSICWYSQFFMAQTVPAPFGGRERH